MNNDGKARNSAEMEEQEQMDVASIFRCIFCSCDVENTDLVPVTKLIEFVQPFMIEDLNALEELRSSLDPEGKNVLVNSERFYEVMGHWSQKLVTNSSEQSEFNKTPGRFLEIDDKDLPYTHSTPRASLGDKLLRCKDLLNLSNVSGYSLSTSKLDKTNNVLEEEIKRLEHLLLKTTNELTITKQQLAASEEQNETNQNDLEKLNRRLHSEQQVNELLQKEKNINEDLRDELTQHKKVIDDLKRKLSHAEKDSMFHKEFVNELDEEKDKLAKKVEFLTRQHQDSLKEIFDIKTELETREQQINDVKKVYEELKFKFAEQKDFIDQLREQNEILSHQRSTLEKVIKAKSTTSIHSHLGNLSFSPPSSSLSQHHTPNTCSPPFVSPNSLHLYAAQPKSGSKPLLRQVLGRPSSTPTGRTNSLLDSSVPNNINNLPVLSPIYLERIGDQNQESSEEDLYFQLEQERDKLEKNDPNGTSESLHTEMHRAEPDGISETYPTVWFEKDEQIMVLEEELESVKKYLKEVEDEKNELLTKLKEQQKVNESLIETNFVLITKEESSQTKIKSLKKRLEQLEGNGIIVENEHEVTLGEIEELKSKIEKMNNEIKSKDIKIQELKANIVLHEKEITELKKKLECSKKQKILENEEDESLVNEYKEKLRLKDEQTSQLKNTQQRNNEELELANKKLKEDLSDCLSKLSSKSRNLIDTQNRLKLLGEREIQLSNENNSLKREKLEFESALVNLKMERDTFFSNLQNPSNFDLVSTEIQKHINSKNEVIEELKQLNLKMEYNLNEAQSDLKQKIDDILKLRNEWTNSIGIRNDLWQMVRTLQEENQELLNSKEELKIEYNNLLICYDLEAIKNTKLEKERMEEKSTFTKFISESEAKLYELQSQKKDKDKVSKLIKTDNMSQTTTSDCKVFEEEFSKIKVESDKLLEELESRLNEEVNKNKILTNNLIEIKEHLDQSNRELLKMKEKVTENELKMLAKLQENSESNKMLAKKLSATKENLQAKDAKLTELGDRLKEMEKTLQIVNEKRIEQKKSQMENESKNKELLKNIQHLETLLNERQKKIKESEDSINHLVNELNLTKAEIDKLNVELGNAALELSRTKNESENCSKEMKKELKILNEKIIDQNKSQMETENKNDELLKNINQLQTSLNTRQIKINELEHSFNLVVNEFNLTKAEKDKLNIELSDATLQLSKTKIEFKKLRDSLEHRLNEEENKNNDLNKHLIEIKNNLDQKEIELDTLNKIRNKLIADLRNVKETNKKLNEELSESKKSLFDKDNKLSPMKQANYKLGQDIEQKKTEIVFLQNTNRKLLSELDLSKNEKEVLNSRLLEEIDTNTLISQNYSLLKTERDLLLVELNDMKTLVLEVKEEVNQKCLHIEKISVELDEAKRKLAKTVSCDSSTAKELGKPRTYLKQQITIDKLKDKLDYLENQLKCEKNKNQELHAQLSLTESRIMKEKTLEELEKEIAILENRIKIEKGLEISSIEAEGKIKDLKRTRSVPSLPKTSTSGDSINKTTECEGKPVNKFTLASRPASPDSPSLDLDLSGLESARRLSFYTKGQYLSCDTVLEIPSLDINGLPDDIIEDLGLTEDSPRKKLNRKEAEKSVTALTLRFVINNKDISERIEKQTEKYRNQYEELLTLIRDISSRLRDHVCIGTAEPIMPVFVILEDIKKQLKELVQTAGQMGVLIYEDRMKKCWNLVTNYMAMLRQENESLSNVSRETTPTQTGLLRRRNRSTHEKNDLHEQTPRRRRRFIPCLRLTTILIVILALALTISLVIHINCRMTASENQYCPLDGVVTRINMGVPPM